MKLEFHDYKHLSWGPAAAIVGTLAIFFGGQVLAGVIIFLVLLAFGWDVDRITDWLNGGGTAQFILSALVGLVTISLLYVFLRRRHAKPSDLGIRRPKLRDIGYALAGLGTYIVLYIGIVNVLTRIFTSLNLEQQQDLGFSTETTGSALLLIFVSLVILPPLVEEIMARGFLYSGLRKGLRKGFDFLTAAVITSALFGVAHLSGGEGGSTIWIAFVDTFILSMVLVYLRERTGSLWASIGLHGLKNLIAFLALFVFKIA
jgi:membrane protease YdiL (CAAX protease family)